LKLNITNIKTVEDGCFQAFRQDRDAVRMTLDWLDFSVEHMSKWWKVAQIFNKDDVVPFNRAVTAFSTYTRNAVLNKESPLQATIAIIAFQPFVDKKRDDSLRARSLTVYSLAATIASLINVGMGRVVVTGMNDKDYEIVQETFRYLRITLDSDGADNTQPVTSIGPMEVGFVILKKQETKTSSVELNIPKAALYVLQHAFTGNLDTRRNQTLSFIQSSMFCLN
jgi:hypothetical protein